VALNTTNVDIGLEGHVPFVRITKVRLENQWREMGRIPASRESVLNSATKSRTEKGRAEALPLTTDKYNHSFFQLMHGGILIGLGISLIARSCVIGLKREPSPQA